MKQALYAAMDGMPVINTHSHHAPAAEQRNLTLKTCWSRAMWAGARSRPRPTAKAERPMCGG